MEFFTRHRNYTAEDFFRNFQSVLEQPPRADEDIEFICQRAKGHRHLFPHNYHNAINIVSMKRYGARLNLFYLMLQLDETHLAFRQWVIVLLKLDNPEHLGIIHELFKDVFKDDPKLFDHILGFVLWGTIVRPKSFEFVRKVIDTCENLKGYPYELLKQPNVEDYSKIIDYLYQTRTSYDYINTNNRHINLHTYTLQLFHKSPRIFWKIVKKYNIDFVYFIRAHECSHMDIYNFLEIFWDLFDEIDALTELRDELSRLGSIHHAKVVIIDKIIERMREKKRVFKHITNDIPNDVVDVLKSFL